jgi:osmotically-inducible protein OsmY
MIRTLVPVTLTLGLLIGPVGCGDTARGVVQDTRDNTTAVKGGLQTLDVKSAIIADKSIDSGAIDVDTYADKKLIVIRGSVPTEAQKTKASEIAQKNAEGYKIDNQLAVVPRN